MRFATATAAVIVAVSLFVLPLRSPVRWVPHPDRGTTILVPVLGGTW